jgi:hypothetical protein
MSNLFISEFKDILTLLKDLLLFYFVYLFYLFY